MSNILLPMRQSPHVQVHQNAYGRPGHLSYRSGGVIAVFSVRSWQEERNQACSAQWLAYNTTANTVKNLGGSADIDKVLGKLRDFAERCLPEGTENNS